jgi:hypothetical protein
MNHRHPGPDIKGERFKIGSNEAQFETAGFIESAEIETIMMGKISPPAGIDAEFLRPPNALASGIDNLNAIIAAFIKSHFRFIRFWSATGTIAPACC